MAEVEHNRRAEDKTGVRPPRLSEVAEGIIGRVVKAKEEENLVFRVGFAGEKATRQYGFVWDEIFAELEAEGYVYGTNDCYFRTGQKFKGTDPKVIFMGIVKAILERNLTEDRDGESTRPSPEAVDYKSLMGEHA